MEKSLRNRTNKLRVENQRKKMEILENQSKKSNIQTI